MPTHVAHHQIHPSPIPDLGTLSHGFDTSLLRKEKELYEGYNFERINPQHPNEKATWSLVTKTRMPVSQGDLLAMVNKQKRKRSSAAWDLLQSDEMKGYKRLQVDELINNRARSDPRFEYTLAGLKLDQTRDKRGNRGTSAFQVILKRQLRKDLANPGPMSLEKLHEQHREIVDLTGGSQAFSEGSSQDYVGGGPPSPHQFAMPPHHGFPDHHGFGAPTHQPPFIHQAGPPMHEGHSGMVHGSPPAHHHMPQMEDPFVHPDHLQAHLPPHFAAHKPSHMPPHGGHPEKQKEPKHTTHKAENKGHKPQVHQEKPRKPESKHRKSHSEPEWDFLSESSEASQAYTDQTADTSYYSNNSSRKDSKHHGGKDSRRSSRSHQDHHDHDKHEQVYRMHRRKPAASPDRSQRSNRPRYEVEEIEVVPASNTRVHRPYLPRSRTSAHRSERLVERIERPINHSRHMSYDDDRHYDFRGLTPPGRRSSVYAAKRPLALDLYDARDEQDRLEMNVRRELVRENERRKPGRGEAIARQLEREAEEIRRHDNVLGRDRLYDDRPGHYSRGYDNEYLPY
ncbi:MAG: hypothetical protein Q9220_005321 [cf. Caloplaca sp. 1 TL-2023]